MFWAEIGAYTPPYIARHNWSSVRYAFARCQAKTTLKSYWHELRDHQEYSKKIDMKTGTHTQVPVPMTIEALERAKQLI